MSDASTTRDASAHARAARRLAGCREGLHLAPLAVDGRLSTLVGLTLQAEGCRAAVGSRCLIETGDGDDIEAEVIGFDRERTLLMPAGSVDGLRPGARVRPLRRALEVPVGDGLLGRVVDAEGRPIDGRGPLSERTRVPLDTAALDPLARAPVREPFDVGVRAINALLTLGRGQRGRPVRRQRCRQELAARHDDPALERRRDRDRLDRRARARGRGLRARHARPRGHGACRRRRRAGRSPAARPGCRGRGSRARSPRGSATRDARFSCSSTR